MVHYYLSFTIKPNNTFLVFSEDCSDAEMHIEKVKFTTSLGSIQTLTSKGDYKKTINKYKRSEDVR